MAGKCRVAAPLLGGVRGWVYLHATSYIRITALEISAILKKGTATRKCL
jgi:hypothetical protein